MRKWKGKEIQTKRLVTSISPPPPPNVKETSSISRRLVHIKLIVYLFICLFFLHLFILQAIYIVLQD